MANAQEFLPADVARKARTPQQVQAAQPFGLDFPTTQVGVVGNITVAYDPALGSSGLALAQEMLKVVLAPYQEMQSVFGIKGGPITVVVAPLSGNHDGSGGAYHYGCDFTSGAPSVSRSGQPKMTGPR